MKIIDQAAIASVLTPARLVEALRAAFRADIETPLRHHHSIDRGSDETATLLLMPAWHGTNGADEGGNPGYIGTKIVSVFPRNAARGLSTVDGSYLLMSGKTGQPLALLDGRALTLWRTAAASALAADFMARPDARRMVMIGSGALAPHLIRAHMAVRPIEEVAIWNRDPARAEGLAADLNRTSSGSNVRVRAITDLETAVGEADLVSAATLSDRPLVRGTWLKPGVHVDLVGGFTPAMREADDEAIRRSVVFVDTRAGACHEAGDIVQPLAAGILSHEKIRADLFELCRGLKPGRRGPDEITLFKSVGTALEDLAAAALVHEQLGGK